MTKINKYNFAIMRTKNPKATFTIFKTGEITITGAKNENKQKIIARHEVETTLSEILNISYKLLKDKGEFFMIHRVDRLVDILSEMRAQRLEPKEIQFIHPYVNKSPNLVMLRAVKNGGRELKVLDPLVVYNEDGEYTDEILKIYGKK